MGENRCVCCGDIIPEGRQICPICEQRKNTVRRETIVEYIKRKIVNGGKESAGI